MSVETENAAPRPPDAPGFREEWQKFAETLPYKSAFLILLLAWFALFHFLGNGTFGYAGTPSIFGWLKEVYRYSSDDETLAMIIPAVILMVLWWKRASLAALPKEVSWPALGVFGLALLLHVVGYVVQQPRVSLVALLFGLYALTGVLWGWPWLKATVFPMFLLVFLVPVPMDLEGMTVPLRLVSASTAVATGHVFGVSDVAREGTTIVFPERHLRFEVEAACSGLRSLTIMGLVACIFAFVFFRSPWRRGLIIFSAIPLAMISNSLRLLSIIIGGDWKYAQLQHAGLPLDQVRRDAEAFGSYVHEHQVLKLMPYLLGFTCLMLLAKWLRDDADEPGKSTAKGAS